MNIKYEAIHGAGAQVLTVKATGSIPTRDKETFNKRSDRSVIPHHAMLAEFGR